jgi:O-antigen/teichoic acid export membrane protein
MKVDLTTARLWTNLTLGRLQPASDGQRRYVRILQAVLTNLAGRGVGVLVSVISIPLTVNYLGAERYGVWVTISTMLMWLNIADLGLGNGLTNALSECYGNNRPDLAQRYVATAFWILSGLAGAIGALFALVWPVVDWPMLFNINSDVARAEIGPAVALAVGIFLFQLPLSLTAKIYNAHQEGALANVWAAAGNVASLLALIVVTQARVGLVWLIFAISGTVFVVSAANTLWLFAKKKPWLLPKPRFIDRNSVKRLLSTGGMFFVIQIAVLLIFQTDNIIIARFLGAQEVTPYSIAWRLFSYATLIQAFIFPNLWPAYSEAFARRDNAWIKHAFRTNLAASLLLTIFCILPLVLFGREIISLWVGIEAVPPFSLLLWMGGWSIIYTVMTSVACILNGSGNMRGQMIYGMATAIINIALSIVLVIPFGITGVIAATVIAYLVCNVIPASVEVTYLLKRLANQ